MPAVHMDQKNFDRLVMEEKRTALVDFWSPRCGPCRMLGPVIEQLAEEYEGKDVLVGKVDVDESPELAARYGVMSVPTVILFQNGEEKDRKVGVMPFEVYDELLDGALS